MSKLKVKICGMRESDNIRQLSALPVDYMGLIFYPKSKRWVEDSDFVQPITTTIPKVGVFVDQKTEEIMEMIGKYDLTAVQLHGKESPLQCQELRKTGIEVWKAFGIDNAFDFNILDKYENVVDYFLFDTKTVQHGGSGQTFEWTLIEQYSGNRAYFLSGGLHIGNLSEVFNIKDPRFKGVDLNSKFEIRPGLKDISLVKQALQIIKG